MDLLSFWQPIICISVACIMIITIFAIGCYFISHYKDK